jgi:ABC-type multidrug transport system fused ATPase/permease subunit
VAETRTVTLRRFLDASWALQARERRGHLQEATTTQAIQQATMLSSAIGLMTSSLTLLALLIGALFANAFATVLATLVVIALAVALRPLRARLRRRSALTAQANAELASAVSEVADTTREIRTFRGEEAVAESFSSAIEKYSRSYFRTTLIGGVIPAIYQGLALLLIVATLGVIYVVDVRDVASLGVVVLIMLRALSYGQFVQTSYQGVIVGAPYVERLRADQARYENARVDRSGHALDAIESLAFEDVSFAYEQGAPVLRNVSFDLPRGSMLGIVGPSGSGKSTLVQLLLRLRQPTNGVVLANGQDAQGYRLDDWYKRIAFVPQEARLIPGSVAENIRFFRDASDESVERAARLAHLHEDICGWPDGYQTDVGQRGGEISGGQSQRLCIARALLEDPSVIVLDEPTSALDVHSENMIRDTLSSLVPDKTVIVIAHRLTTLSACTLLLVLRAGQLEAFGAPYDIERQSDFYADTLRVSGLR